MGIGIYLLATASLLALGAARRGRLVRRPASAIKPISASGCLG